MNAETVQQAPHPDPAVCELIEAAKAAAWQEGYLFRERKLAPTLSANPYRRA